MKRYYVKSLFTGWREVSKEHFDRFVEHIRQDSNGLLTVSAKEEYIKSRTRIEEDDENG